MSQGFARNGWPRGNEIITPADWVAHATPHTKGSWVEVDASAAGDVCGVWISSDVTIGVGGVDTSMLVDIGVGGAGSELVVVSNIPVGGHHGGVVGSTSLPRWFLPIHIPAGSRIAGRIQAAVTVDVYDPFVTLLFGGRPGSWGGYSIAETIGVDTATSAPTTGDLADNAWDEAVASTANAYRALTFHAAIPPSATLTGGTALVDVGVGGAGSERVLGTWRVVSSVATEMILRFDGPEFLEVGISAGSRLAIRKNGTVDMSGALIGWR